MFRPRALRQPSHEIFDLAERRFFWFRAGQDARDRHKDGFLNGSYEKEFYLAY
jgi:hypothetical protein